MIQAVQLRAQPVIAGQALFGSKTVGLGGIKHQVKAEFDNQQRMLHEKAAQLGGVDKAFADAQQEGFELGTGRMA